MIHLLEVCTPLATVTREFSHDLLGNIRHRATWLYRSVYQLSGLSRFKSQRLAHVDLDCSVADPFLVGTVSSADRPWTNSRVGHGIAYVIITALQEDTLFTGIPQDFLFELSSIPLYDPSKDDTAGGSAIEAPGCSAASVVCIAAMAADSSITG